MMWLFQRTFVVVLAMLLTASGMTCHVFGDEPFRKTHERLHGTLWLQGALEYDVACQQAYSLARLSLKEYLSDNSRSAAIEQDNDYRSLPPAVILDIDETVLNNSPFQARLVEQGVDYNEAQWVAWVNEGKAKAIPGASGFLQLALSCGVKIFFVTNRTSDLETVTVANLKQELGFRITADMVLCKNEKPEWTSDKSSRRREICKTHRVVCLVGDEFNDFAFIGKPPASERLRLGQILSERWGNGWIILPNPLYGDWEKSLYDYSTTLTDREILEKKYQRLETENSK